MKPSRLLSAGALQAANLLVPLVTVPILVARVGISGFGQYAAMMAVSVILVAVGDFGVQLQGVKALARADADYVLLGYTRFFLLRRSVSIGVVAAIPFGMLLLGLIPSVVSAGAIAIICTAQLFAAGWALQGVGRLRTAQFCMLVGRLIFMVLIVFLVSSDSSFVLLLFFECVVFCLYCLLTWVAFVREVGSPLGAETLRPEVGNPNRLTLAAVVQTLYSQLPTVLLINLHGGAAAGQYALGERIANVVRRVMFSMSSDAMPLLAKQSAPESIIQMRKVSRVLVSFCGISGMATLAIAFWMRRALEAHGGHGQLLVVTLFVVLCMFWLLTNIYGVLGLVVIAGDERAYTDTIMFWSAIGIGALWFAAGFGGAAGVVVALLCIEVVIASLLRHKFRGFGLGMER